MGIHSSRTPSFWPEGPWTPGLLPAGTATASDLVLKRTHDKHDATVKTSSLRQVSGKSIDKGTEAALGANFFTAPLDSGGAVYRTIAMYIGAAALDSPYKTDRFEAARLKTGGQITPKTMQQFLRPTLKVPEFNVTSYRLKRILAVYNASRWNTYCNMRAEYRTNLAPGSHALMQRLNWAAPPSDPFGWGIQFPVIDQELGECYLFHGTNKGTLPFITGGGFGPEFCAYRANAFSGYGALGQGSYLSDNLAKSATYAPCPSCQKNGPCACVDANGNAVERYALIARTIVPTDTETHKGKRTTNFFAHQHVNLRGQDQRSTPIQPGTPQAVPSDQIGGPKVVLGIKTTGIGGIKKWANNEFLFRDKAMLYPEFVVCFTWPL
ncbi:MAG TPA: hypothetical protein VGD62_02055 [Acidobacteriaceae bacterium]